MIQRIQTIFLLLAVIAQAFFIKLPLSTFVLDSSETINFFSIGFKDLTGEIVLSTLTMYILAWVILILISTSIFLYKKRILQIRFCTYNMLLNLGMVVMLILQISNFTKNYAVISQSYAIAMVLPIISIILLYLAFRGIRKDELLVKAYDRLR